MLPLSSVCALLLPVLFFFFLFFDVSHLHFRICSVTRTRMCVCVCVNSSLSPLSHGCDSFFVFLCNLSLSLSLSVEAASLTSLSVPPYSPTLPFYPADSGRSGAEGEGGRHRDQRAPEFPHRPGCRCQEPQGALIKNSPQLLLLLLAVSSLLPASLFSTLSPFFPPSFPCGSQLHAPPLARRPFDGGRGEINAAC